MFYLSKIPITTYPARQSTVGSCATDNERNQAISLPVDETLIKIMCGYAFIAADNIPIDKGARGKVCNPVLPSRGEGPIPCFGISGKRTVRYELLVSSVCDSVMAGSDRASSIQSRHY
jgi:hypothetical protein